MSGIIGAVIDVLGIGALIDIVQAWRERRRASATRTLADLGKE